MLFISLQFHGFSKTFQRCGNRSWCVRVLLNSGYYIKLALHYQTKHEKMTIIKQVLHTVGSLHYTSNKYCDSNVFHQIARI